VIYIFKYNFVQSLDKELSDLMIERIKENDGFFEPKITAGYFDYILSVPLHRYRFLWRGFNQAQSLVDKISAFLGLKSGQNFVVRKKYSSHQAGKTRHFREKSLEGAFGVDLKLTLEERNEIKGKKILLVDDVLTTGFTMQEVAKVLKNDLKTGEVWGIVIARSS